MPDYGTTKIDLIERLHTMMQADERFSDLPADAYHIDAALAELHQTNVFTMVSDTALESTGAGHEMISVELTVTVTYVDPTRTKLGRIYEVEEGIRQLLNEKPSLDNLDQVQFANWKRTRPDRASLEDGVYSTAEVVIMVRMLKTT